jgi:ubiquitin carboxyl-terminal hydrolase L5
MSCSGTLYELDGLQPAAISHGPCSRAEFSEKVIPVLERRIGRYPQTEIRFNLMALKQDPRIKAREIGDNHELSLQERKRRHWVEENALRSHNFVDFIGELMKVVVDAKVDKGEYDQWIDAAKKKTLERVKKRGDVSSIIE